MAGTPRPVYGPVDSRRLGRSLGLDPVPYKTCTYDCVYCQLGRTTDKTLTRKDHVPLDEMIRALERKLEDCDRLDYITVAGSGEPTLNVRLGELIDEIKARTTIPVAVLTNGSLLWQEEVRQALNRADLVVPSLDAGSAGTFQAVNRPHPDIGFEKMTAGLTTFRQGFQGQVWLEVCILAGMTDGIEEVERMDSIADRIRPDRIQINTPTRPPCEAFARPVSTARLGRLAGIFRQRTEVVREVDFIAAKAGFSDGVTDEDILALLRRRPCTVRGVSAGLGMHMNEVLKRLPRMVDQGVVSTSLIGDQTFYQVRSEQV
ncbi:MAG: radical SAM protein [Proteobacteria bacterium]|nr:radical SAM protein [Pseudomonadota bacterium]